MNKLSKKQLAALYILVAIVCICLIGAFIVLRKNSNDTKETSNTVTTTTQAAETDTSEDVKKAASVTDMVTELTPLLGLETTSTLDADKIAYYYEIDTSDMEECAGVIGDVALADELVIMKAKDAAALDKLKAGAESRLESQKTSFQDYIPEQAKRLENAQIVTEGNYVMFICCDDMDTVVDKFKAMVEK